MIEKVDIRSARLNKGLSAAAAAKEIGITRSILTRAEDGTSVPFPRHAKKIADFYGVQVTDIWPVSDTQAAAA